MIEPKLGPRVCFTPAGLATNMEACRMVSVKWKVTALQNSKMINILLTVLVGLVMFCLLISVGTMLGGIGTIEILLITLISCGVAWLFYRRRASPDRS